MYDTWSLGKDLQNMLGVPKSRINMEFYKLGKQVLWVTFIQSRESSNSSISYQKNCSKDNICDNALSCLVWEFKMPQYNPTSFTKSYSCTLYQNICDFQYFTHCLQHTHPKMDMKYDYCFLTDSILILTHKLYWSFSSLFIIWTDWTCLNEMSITHRKHLSSNFW